jgi:ADP-dependent phosphofructokinase/glucokinase
MRSMSVEGQVVYAPVVLGLGGTVDYEIAWSSATVSHLAATYEIRPDELSTPEVIASERDLVRSILSFVTTGGGGEHFVASSETIETLAARFDRQIALGGTCVRAALAMNILGVPTTVHLVSIDDQVRRRLPADVSYVCSAEHDSTDPHLIVQFPEGARIRTDHLDIRVPRANRLIYVHDVPNREMRLSDELGTVLSSAQYFLVSGFNSMQDPSTLDRRLDELTAHMRDLPLGATVMYEDAAFHRPEFSRRVRERLAAEVDVYSMNEDELQGHLGRDVDLVDPDSVAAALHDLRAVVPARTVVVHTARWSLAFGDEAESYRPALTGGVAAAGARYVCGDGFTDDDSRDVLATPAHVAGAAFAGKLEALMDDGVCCVPGLDLRTATPTIVGLGDTFVGGFLAALARGRLR